VPNLDSITNKDNGYIFLCYGPPGNKKTLTAEPVAEKLKHMLCIR
jgi:SpoVK/Ycf46/Vps4 family AAA+-type ATPase